MEIIEDKKVVGDKITDKLENKNNNSNVVIATQNASTTATGLTGTFASSATNTVDTNIYPGKIERMLEFSCR